MGGKEKEKMSFLEIVITIIVISLFATTIFVFARSHYMVKNEKPQQIEYSLSEIDGGYYAIYTKTVSAVEKGNYEIVTVNTKDRMLTLEGDVTIYSSEQKPKMIFFKL